ncbi:MAG: hypothetical protein GY850_24295 [bacterium]|nr:hypothetical protein [bacterium]
MEEIMMQFLDSEVRRWDIHEPTGEMRMSIPLSMVHSKLPKNKKVNICRYTSRESVEAEFFPRLVGVRFENWVAMNFELTKNGSRMLSTYANLLENLCLLIEKYGKKRVNEALSKCNDPKKCTIAYVKAVLRNVKSTFGKKRRTEKVDEDNYLNRIEKSAARFM